MNFREIILERIIRLLTLLMVDEDRVVKTSDGKEIITPNSNYTGVLRDIRVEPLEGLPTDNPANIPVAFVSFDGGRNDLGVDTFLSHIVEVLGIRIEILLDKKIGVAVDNRPRHIEFQASDLLADITKLVNLTSLQSALHTLETDVTVQDVILEEWEFDERYRGGSQEVLIMVFRAEIANPRNP